jgi:hypothetical protein
MQILAVLVAPTASYPQARWTVAATPTVQIGAVSGPAEAALGTVRTAHQLADGRIAVIDSKARQVYMYGPAGQSLVRIGRRGNGPGEYQSPSWLGSRGDTLLVFDGSEAAPALLRFTKAARPIDKQAVSVGTQGRFPQIVHLLADGSMVLSASSRDETADAMRATPFQLTQKLVRFTMPDRATFIAGAPGQIVRHRDQFNYDDGKRAASDSLIFLNDGQTAAIRILGLDGKHRRTVNPPFTPRKPTADERQQWVNAMLELFRGNLDPRTEGRIRGETFDWTMPVYGNWLTDADGNLWATIKASLLDFGSNAHVFSPAGEHLATVALPSGFKPFQIGRDFIVGLWLNDDDVPFVRVYGLTRAP